MSGLKLVSTGSAMPERVLTNEDHDDPRLNSPAGQFGNPLFSLLVQFFSQLSSVNYCRHCKSPLKIKCQDLFYHVHYGAQRPAKVPKNADPRPASDQRFFI